MTVFWGEWTMGDRLGLDEQHVCSCVSVEKDSQDTRKEGRRVGGGGVC